MLSFFRIFFPSKSPLNFETLLEKNLFFCGDLKRRLSLLLAFFYIGLFISFCVRLIFYIWNFSSISWSPLKFLLLFITGAFYDTVFFIYAAAIPAIYLVFIPSFLWKSLFNRILLSAASLFSIGLMLFVVIAEILFWNEFSTRFNFIAVDYLVYTNEVLGNIWQSYHMGWILLGLFILSLGLWGQWILPVILGITKEDAQPGWKNRLFFTGGYGLIFILCLIGVNNSLSGFFRNHYEEGIAQNGPYQFFYAFRKNEINFHQFYLTLEPATADRMVRQIVAQPGRTFLNEEPMNIYSQTTPHGGLFGHPNIILITVESLSADFLTTFGQKENITPFLDDLVHKSLFFRNFYATGTRTTRGLEAVTLSLPPTPGRSIVKRLGNENDHWSLARILNERGYQSTFFYGGSAYFDNMRAFFSTNGYDVFEESDIPDGEATFKNAWGVSDDVMVNQILHVADERARAQKPFFFHWMTITNHRPFTYPDNKIDIPSTAKSRHGGVKFTDWALGDLIRRAQKKPWFDKTLFVILADHDAAVAGKTSIPVNKYHIPLFIYGPKLVRPKEVMTLGSQTDLAPTLLGILGRPYKSYFFGRDLLAVDPSTQRAYLGTYQSIAQLYPDGGLFILSPSQIAQKQDREGRLSDTALTDIRLQETIAVYQAADYILNKRLDRYSIKHPQADFGTR